MNTKKVNGVWFKGQYADVLEYFMKGNEVTMHDFSNGSWEATTKVGHFTSLLDKAGIKYTTEGTSLRSLVIKNKH